MIDPNELKDFLNKNNGKFVVLDQGTPKAIILDPEKYPRLLTNSQDQDAKVLVTGGAGFIGSHAVNDLLDDGFAPVVFDNLSTGSSIPTACPLVVGDLLDPIAINKVFEQFNVTAVIHFAGSIIVEESILNPEKYFLNNVVGSINLLNAMVKHNVKRLVYSSTAAVYGNPRYVPIDESHPCQPTNPYGESKLAVERIIDWYHNAYDLSAVIFRYFNAAGASPEDNSGEAHPIETHLIPRVLKVANKQDDLVKIFGSDYPTSDGTAIRDYIHVKDLAHAHTLALNKLIDEGGMHTYNVGTGQGYSVAQIIDKVVEITGKMVPIEKVQRRPGDPPILVADNKLIKSELGFEAKHSDLITIITSAWEWHKQKFPVLKQKNEQKNA